MKTIKYDSSNEMIVWGIEILSELSQTRLYWLWIKYCILAGIDQNWRGFKHFQPVLIQLSPITNHLSYDIYVLRIFLYLCLFIKGNNTHPAYAKQPILNDVLWSTSNLLSATYLDSPLIRPDINTPGWWGQMSMQSLLVYDLVILAREYVMTPSFVNKKVGAERITVKHYALNQYQKHIERQMLRANLIYSSILAVGFFLFRGFSTKTSTNPQIGAGLCFIATLWINTTKWNIRNIHQSHCLGHVVQISNKARYHTCMGISIGMDFLLPLCIWLSRKTNNIALIVGLGLIVMAGINIYLKHIAFHPHALHVNKFSFFATTKAPKIEPDNGLIMAMV